MRRVDIIPIHLPLLTPIIILLASVSLLACTSPAVPLDDAGWDWDAGVTRDGEVGEVDASIPDAGTSLDDVVALVPDPSSVSVTQWLGICVRIQFLLTDGSERRARPGEVTFEPTDSFGPAPWLADCEGITVQGRVEGMFTIPISAGGARSAFGLEVLPATGVSVDCGASDAEGQDGFADGVGTPLLLRARALGRGIADPSAMRVRIEPSTAASFARAFDEANPAIFGTLRIEEPGDYTIHCEWTGDGAVLGSSSVDRVAVPGRTTFDDHASASLSRSVVRDGDEWFSRALPSDACTELELLTIYCHDGGGCERHATDPGAIVEVEGGAVMGPRVCPADAGEVRVATRRDGIDTDAFFWVAGSIVDAIDVTATGPLTRELDVFLVPIELHATVSGRVYAIESSTLVSIALHEQAVVVDDQDWSVEVPSHPGTHISLSLHNGDHPFAGKLALNLENGAELSETALDGLAAQLRGARARFSVRYPNHRGGGSDEPVVELTVPE